MLPDTEAIYQESSNFPSFALCSNGTVNLPPHLYLSKLCLFFHSQNILEHSHSFSYIALDCSHLGTSLTILSLKYRQPIPFSVPRNIQHRTWHWGGLVNVWHIRISFIEFLVRMLAQVPLFKKKIQISNIFRALNSCAMEWLEPLITAMCPRCF